MQPNTTKFNQTKILQNSAQFNTIQPKSTKFFQFFSNATQFNLIQPKFDQIQPDLTQFNPIQPKFYNIQPYSTQFNLIQLNSAKFRQFNPTQPKSIFFHPIQPNSPPIHPNSVQFYPNSPQNSLNDPQIASYSLEFTNKSPKVAPLFMPNSADPTISTKHNFIPYIWYSYKVIAFP